MKMNIPAGADRNPSGDATLPNSGAQWPWFAHVLGVAVLYLATAKLGFLMAIHPGNVTAVWPPSGIALAVLLLWGNRLWPGIWLGAFLANTWVFKGSAVGLVDIGVGTSIGVGSVFQALAGASLLRLWIGGNNPLEGAAQVFRFALVALVMCVISSTIGVSSLCVAGMASWTAFGETWLTWWLGDLAGVLVVTPVLLAWALPAARGHGGRLREALLMFFVLAIISLIVFGQSFPDGRYPLGFLVFPSLIWAALRFDQRVVTLAIVGLAGVAIWWTVHGGGPFAMAATNESLLLLQSYVGVVTLATLILFASVAERRREVAERQRAEKNVERLLNDTERSRRALLGIMEDQKRADEALRVSEQRLRLVVEAANDGVWEWDLFTDAVFWSERSHELVGLVAGSLRLDVAAINELVHPDDRERLREAFRAHLKGGAPHQIEVRLRHSDGSYRDFIARGKALRNAAGRAIRMAGSLTDITEGKRAEKALRESEERFRQLAENIREVFWLTDPTKNTMLYISPAYENIWAQSRESLYASPRAWLEAIHPEDRGRVIDAAIHKQIAGTYDEEYRIVRPDGTLRWIHDKAFPVRNAAREIYRIAGVAEDITERKLAEHVLRENAARLRDLSRRLVETEEAERRKITRELHDRVGQSLSALNLNINRIRVELSKDSLRAAGSHLDDAQKLLQETTRHVRNVMADLHPPALDDFGLWAALRTYAESYSTRVGVPVTVNGKDLEPRLPPAAEMALFRIAQETLDNVAKHAHAKRVEIMLAATAERVTMTIADDGIGYEVEHAEPGRPSWGLAIMRERAEAAGANLLVESARGRGTRVIVELARKAT